MCIDTYVWCTAVQSYVVTDVNSLGMNAPKSPPSPSNQSYKSITNRTRNISMIENTMERSRRRKATTKTWNGYEWFRLKTIF